MCSCFDVCWSFGVASDDGCINVRNMLSTEEVKLNLINCDIKLVSYSSTITMMHGPIYIRFTFCNTCISRPCKNMSNGSLKRGKSQGYCDQFIHVCESYTSWRSPRYTLNLLNNSPRRLRDGASFPWISSSISFVSVAVFMNLKRNLSVRPAPCL